MRAILATAFVAVLSLPALSQTRVASAPLPPAPAGMEWYQHDTSRACWTARKRGSGVISSPTLTNGQLVLYRTGLACNYSASSSAIRGGEFAGQTATWINR